MTRSAHVDGTASSHLTDIDNWLEASLERIQAGRASARQCCDLAALARASRIHRWPDASERVLEADALAVERGWSRALEPDDGWQLFTYRHAGTAIAIRGGAKIARISAGADSVILSVPELPTVTAQPGGPLTSARIDKRVVRVQLGDHRLLIRRSRLDLVGSWRVRFEAERIGLETDQRIAGIRVRAADVRAASGSVELTDARLDW